jgi:hypothetical protein
MAQKMMVQIVDDLDGSKADESVTFGLDGVSYEIDLSKRHAKSLRNVLTPLIEHGRRVGGRRRVGTHPSPAGTRSSTERRERSQAIRQWAREHNIEIAERGRLPLDVEMRYDQAQAHGRRR